VGSVYRDISDDWGKSVGELYSEDETEGSMTDLTLQDVFRANLKLRGDYYRKFGATFGWPLASFFNNLTGFDIVKFDDVVVKPPDGTSTKDAVFARWGQEGVDIILGLLGPEPKEETIEVEAQ
jgi:hypothetical protein